MWVPHTLGPVSCSRILCLACEAVGLFLDDRFERRPHRLHANMAVVAEHTLRDMAGNVHDGLIAGAAFREVRDEGVAIVVPPAGHLGVLPDIAPGRLESSDRPRRIAGAGLAKGKHVPFRTSFAKLFTVPGELEST